MHGQDHKNWTDAEKGKVYEKTSADCLRIENKQSALFRKFRQMVALHNPRSFDSYGPYRKRTMIPSFNLVALNVDSVHSSLASQPVRTRIITEGAEWSIQRQARQLQRYSDSLYKRLSVQKHAKRVVWTSALKGLGIAKVSANAAHEIKVQSVQPDDIFVDDDEVDGCETKRLHHRYYIDAHDLIADYPKHSEEILKARGNRFLSRRYEGKKKLSENQVVVVESWALPCGSKKHKKSYRPGRHTVCIDGADLLDETYEKKHYPIAVFRWSEGDGSSFYGHGGAERVAHHQSKLAKLDFCNDRQIENNARPVTYTTLANIGLLGQRKIAATGQYIPTTDGKAPQTVTGPSVSGDQLSYRSQVKEEGFEAFGNSRQLIDGSVPNQLESGVAVREARQTATGKWALQEQDFEQLCMDIMWLVFDTCRDLGKNAPEVMHTTFKRSKKKLRWAAVDMELVRDQIAAASPIAQTPAARQSMATELLQAGAIGLDESRRLINNPDIGRTSSIWTAAIESVERQIEEILDGEIIMPTSHTPFKLAIWRFTQAILAAENDGAPEDAIERLRNYNRFAIDLLKDKEEKAMAQQAALAAPPPGAAPSGLDPTAAPPPDVMPIVPAA